MEDPVQQPACGELGMRTSHEAAETDLQQAQDRRAFEAGGDLQGKKLMT